MASALQKWMLMADPNAVSLIPRQIGSRGGGYGMVANTAIKKGDKLVAVPRKLWMTSQTAKKSPICKKIILDNELESWQAMCIHLLCERRSGKESFWSDYVELLPNQAEHPLLWTPDQQQKLKGSPMLKRLNTRLQQVAGDTEVLQSLGVNELFSGDDSDLVSLDTVKWAAATLLSRAFNLEIPTAGLESRPLDRTSTSRRDGSVDFMFDTISSAGDPMGEGSDDHEDVYVESDRILALVPWADTLNHSSDAWDRSILQYDHVEDVAVLFAHRDYTPGEEVYDSYGTWLTPSELLLDYGFVDAANRNFAIQCPAEAIASPASQVNAQLLEQLHASLNGAPELTLTETAVDDTLLSYMRCAVAPADELASAGWDASSDNPSLPMDTMAKLVEPCNFNTEARVLETLLAWCDKQMAGYSTSLQSDLENVERESTTWLDLQILRALISEKKTVLGLQKELRTRNQLLKEGCPLDQLYV